MKDFDEKTALAIIFANTKRKKRTNDLVTVAQSFKYLVELYGSQKALSEKVGLSTEIVREFLKVLTLVPEVQELIKSRKIDSLDIAYRISKIKDPSKQTKMAQLEVNEAAELTSKEVRDVERLTWSSGLSVENSREAILKSKLKGIHVFVMDFNNDEYHLILERAKGARMDPVELVKLVVINWLKEDSRSKLE